MFARSLNKDVAFLASFHYDAEAFNSIINSPREGEQNCLKLWDKILLLAQRIEKLELSKRVFYIEFTSHSIGEFMDSQFLYSYSFGKALNFCLT